jgi:hypothetical protein
MVICDRHASGLVQHHTFSVATPFFLIRCTKSFGEFLVCFPDPLSDLQAKPGAQSVL